MVASDKSFWVAGRTTKNLFKVKWTTIQTKKGLLWSKSFTMALAHGKLEICLPWIFIPDLYHQKVLSKPTYKKFKKCKYFSEIGQGREVSNNNFLWTKMNHCKVSIISQEIGKQLNIGSRSRNSYQMWKNLKWALTVPLMMMRDAKKHDKIIWQKMS